MWRRVNINISYHQLAGRHHGRVGDRAGNPIRFRKRDVYEPPRRGDDFNKCVENSRVRQGLLHKIDLFHLPVRISAQLQEDLSLVSAKIEGRSNLS